MTAYRTILACLSDPETAPATLELALQVAAAHNAHLEALHVRIDPTSAVPLVGEGMSGAMVEEMLALAESRSAERAAKVRAVFDEACRLHNVPLQDDPTLATGVSAAWREVVGREEEAVAMAGRLSDLVVMARPLPERDSAPLMSLNAVLMESGRALLLAPPVPAKPLGRHVAVLWNGSAEASRAIAFARPFLTAAETVTIFSAREEELVVAEDLAHYLAWHGIKARVQTFPAGSQVGTSLLNEVTAAGADMVVMGAYTHSRLRQLILGGVTRHVLQTATLPVLLSH